MNKRFDEKSLEPRSNQGLLKNFFKPRSG